MTMPPADPDMRGVVGILLAAGSSRRFGADKQATLIGSQTMLEHAAHTLLDAGLLSPIVVLGQRADQHRNLLRSLPVRVVENPTASTGMASSLIAALDAAGECEAIVVTVCDQPAVSAAHLRALVQQWRSHQAGATIVASSYGDARGVPALFAALHFAELRQLKGDRGAGPLLTRHAATVALLPLAGGEMDLDTAVDLDCYLRHTVATDGCGDGRQNSGTRCSRLAPPLPPST